MKIRSITLVAMFAAVTAVCSQISIPIPFSQVPFSMGIFAVLLTGALLPKYQALAAQLVYLLIGAVGIPVYAQFTGGLSILAGPVSYTHLADRLQQADLVQRHNSTARYHDNRHCLADCTSNT